MPSRTKRLVAARKKRLKISQMMAELEEGELVLQDIILETPPELNTCRLWSVMLRTPKLGEKGARKTLENAHVWPTVRLGNLTEEERRRVVQHLPHRVNHH